MALSRLFYLVLFLFTSGCAVLATQAFNDRYGELEPTQRRVSADSTEAEIYHNQVQPILEQRCVTCHACYDAPCQLKLTSPDGIERGLNPDPVYNGTRLLAADPTRLNMDAFGVDAWRERGFHPVLNERRRTSNAHFGASVMYRSIHLRQQQDKPTPTVLPDSYDFSLARDQQCPSDEQFDAFAQQYPEWGMPYGLPALTQKEFKTLADWIGRGGWLPEPGAPSNSEQAAIDRWEARFNQDDLKSQLINRYIYEHIYLYSLYLDQAQNRRAPHYRLVRSSTPPGQPLKVIATRRPYDDPGGSRVWYRLMPERESVVAKSHIPMVLTEQRWHLWQQYLNTPDTRVERLPGYETEVASNPFKTFAYLPSMGRYRFLLEHARDTIMAFIKGPVCRGQVAVNVINEQFWIWFVNPDINYHASTSTFLAQEANHLDLPARQSSNTLPISSWIEFSDKQKDYLKAKSAFVDQLISDGLVLDEHIIWNGEGHNPNAALTVLRHFDNATVVQGLLGQAPKTAWVIDYPLLERIHYLLVAGFDVYGNVGHQLVTRLYMDFLRMEGEMNFLLFLPKAQRQQIHQYWYREANTTIKDYIFSDFSRIQAESGIQYQTDDRQAELYQRLQHRLAEVLTKRHEPETSPWLQPYQDLLEQLETTTGASLQHLPEVSRILLTQQGKPVEVLSLIHNRGHLNINSLFDEQSALIPEEDSLTLALGAVGDYPNVLMQVELAELNDWVTRIQTLANASDYSQLLDAYGIRRTHPEFWTVSDQIQQLTSAQAPLSSGIPDYNRLENR